MVHWYAVYTRPRCEKKVAEGLAKKALESYCPFSKAGRSWTGLRASAKALFPSCVFVRVAEDQLAEVKKVEGVINLIYWLGAPVRIRAVEIEMIRRFLNVHKTVLVEPAEVAPAAMVQLSETNPSKPQVHDNPPTGISVVEARLLLPSLGCVLVATPQAQAYPPQHYLPVPQQTQHPFLLSQTP